MFEKSRMTLDDQDELNSIKHIMIGLDMAIHGCGLAGDELNGLVQISDLALTQIKVFIERVSGKVGGEHE